MANPRGNPGNKGGSGAKPLPPGTVKNTLITLRVSARDAARLDATRGSVPRSAWVRLAVLSALEDAQTRREIYPKV